MPIRKDPIIPDEYYHVFNRGINREIIFRSNRNYHFFLRRINEYIKQETALILAYVLMPTHFHMLIQNIGEDFSACMGKLSLSYTKAFNIEWGRSGPLFEGRFKNKLVNQDKYMLQLSKYIHLNPKTAGLMEKTEEWPYSNYSDLISNKSGLVPTSDHIFNYFDNVDPAIGYQRFIEQNHDHLEKNINHLLFD